MIQKIKFKASLTLINKLSGSFTPHPMRLKYLYTSLLLSVGFFVFAQKDSLNSIYAPDFVFEQFHKDMSLLNNSLLKISTLQEKSQTIFEQDIYLINHANQLSKHLDDIHDSFTQFTNLNAKHLVVIDHNLASTIPIKGSEMIYLNKSFLVYKQYAKLYSFLERKISSQQKEKKSKKLQTNLLKIKLNEISFFYKNYNNTISNKRLRRVLNASDRTFDTKDNELKKLSKRLFSRKNYNSIKKLIKSLPNYHANNIALYDHIKTNPYQKSRLKKNKKKIQRFFRKDKTHLIGHFFAHHVSGAVGNFAGLFRFRKGYLYRNDSVYNIIKNQLKPMDILVEKTGFTLTDKMIPGYFGHIAIWLGTEKQLKKNQLWEHPSIVPFQNKIKQEHCILETDRKGTHLKSLKDFINIDEIAIASISGFSKLNKIQKIDLYENALAQLGKKYDFNFDVETSDKLVCSELLYQVFGSIHWPTDSYFKRKTISPDNVLSLVLYKNSPIVLKYYIGAKSRHSIYTKNREDLAKDLNYAIEKDNYFKKGKKCIKTQHKKQCKTVYYPLIYK